MAGIFEMVDRMFAGVVPVAISWDFPNQLCGIPESYPGAVLPGNLTAAGRQLYFTFKFNFVQMKEFKTGLKLLTAKTKAKVGTTQLAAFLISMAGRVGAGNIVGVTGAVTIGGPGAIFWM